MEHVSGITASATYTTSSGPQSYQDVSSTATANPCLDVAVGKMLLMPFERAIEKFNVLNELYAGDPVWQQRAPKIQDMLYAKATAEAMQRDDIIKEETQKIYANVMQMVNATMMTGYDTKDSTHPEVPNDNGNLLPSGLINERMTLVLEDMQKEHEFTRKSDYGILLKLLEEGQIKEIGFLENASQLLDYLQKLGFTKIATEKTIRNGRNALGFATVYPNWERDAKKTPEEQQRIFNVAQLFLSSCRRHGFHLKKQQGDEQKEGWNK